MYKKKKGEILCNNETERCYAVVDKKKTSYWTYISLRSGLKIQQEMRRHIKYRDFQKTIVFNLILMVFNSLFSFFGFFLSRSTKEFDLSLSQ